jgi:LacI family transcriptional regulator
MVNAARPSITSIDLNLRQVGKRAADRLLEAIGGKASDGGTEFVDCFIVPREST